MTADGARTQILAESSTVINVNTPIKTILRQPSFRTVTILFKFAWTRLSVCQEMIIFQNESGSSGQEIACQGLATKGPQVLPPDPGVPPGPPRVVGSLQQKNGSDCKIFVCKTAEFLSQ